MKKIIALILAVAMLLSLAAVSSAEAAEPVVVNVAVAEEQTSLDNVLQTKDVALMIAQNVFETLYCYDTNYQLQYSLAESDSITEDGLTATVTIRKGVLFHDGNEVKAEDVVASFQRWLNVNSAGKDMATYIDSVVATDDYTMTINFNKPYAFWKDQMSWYSGCWYVMPKAIAEAAGENALTWEQNIGTGPFVFVEYAEGRYIKLAKNPGYVSRTEEPSGAFGKREVFIDELYFHFVPDASTRLNGLMSGQFDYACAMSTDDYETINDTEGIHTVANASERCLFLFFNSHSALLKDNYKMREALAMAMNMEDAMGAAYGNPELWHLGTSWYPEGSMYYYENDIAWYNKADAAKAMELAKEAGYNGEEIRVLVNTSYPAFETALTVIIQNLKDAGFNVSDERMDNASLMSKRSDETQWEIFVTHHNFLTVPTGYNPLKSSYAGWWDTEERNTLMTKLLGCTNDDDLAATWREIMDLVTEQIPVVRLGAFTEIYAASDKLVGVGDKYYGYPTFWNITKE